MFEGRGIVIVGGGRLLPQSWVAINALRAGNCTLPAELWIVDDEQPHESLMPHLDRLGVTVRNFDQILPRLTDPLAGRVRGFALKVFACIFSSFAEVLVMDADNVPVRDVEFIFSHAQLRAHGALFWPDYWVVSPSKLPAMAAVLGEAAMQRFGGQTYESGQAMFVKSVGWKALLLGAFFNLEKRFYFQLVSGPVGAGDKDLVPAAWAAIHTQVPAINHPAGSAGVKGPDGLFRGHTMVQHDDDGQALFLHRNLNKFSLCMPRLQQPRKHISDERTWAWMQARPHIHRTTKNGTITVLMTPAVMVKTPVGVRVRLTKDSRPFLDEAGWAMDLEQKVWMDLKALSGIVPFTCSRVKGQVFLHGTKTERYLETLAQDSLKASHVARIVCAIVVVVMCYSAYRFYSHRCLGTRRCLPITILGAHTTNDQKSNKLKRAGRCVVAPLTIPRTRGWVRRMRSRQTG